MYDLQKAVRILDVLQVRRPPYSDLELISQLTI